MIKRVNLDKVGIEMFIGSLEATILRLLWQQNDPLTATQIHNKLIREDNPQAFSTIHTDLLRMHAKGLISVVDVPKRKARHYVASTPDEAYFVAQCVEKALTCLATEYPDYYQRGLPNYDQ